MHLEGMSEPFRDHCTYIRQIFDPDQSDKSAIACQKIYVLSFHQNTILVVVSHISSFFGKTFFFSLFYFELIFEKYPRSKHQFGSRKIDTL